MEQSEKNIMVERKLQKDTSLSGTFPTWNSDPLYSRDTASMRRPTFHLSQTTAVGSGRCVGRPVVTIAQREPKSEKCYDIPFSAELDVDAVSLSILGQRRTLTSRRTTSPRLRSSHGMRFIFFLDSYVSCASNTSRKRFACRMN